MTFWLAAAAIPVVTALLLFRPLLTRGGNLLGLGLALVLLVPVSTLLLYQGVGSPDALDVPRQRPPLADDGPAEMNRLLAQLEARMEERPDDLEGWMLLGRSYRSIERFDEALGAFVKARELAPDNPMVAVELAEALIFTSPPGRPDPSVPVLLDEALSRAPDLQKGLWLAGMMAAQAGDDRQAVSRWEQLLQQLEPNSAVALSVQEQLDLARARLGEPAPDRWPGIEIVVEAPGSLPALSPEAALFVIVRDPASPNPPLGAARLPAAFPARVRITDGNAMMPNRPISGVEALEIQARLALSGNPLAGGDDPESAPVTVDRAREAPLTLTLESP